MKIRLPSQKCFLTRKADDEAFADEQELQDFLSLLMRHWNSIGRKLEEDDVLEVLQLCRPAVIGWLDAPSGLFGLRPVQVAPV